MRFRPEGGGRVQRRASANMARFAKVIWTLLPALSGLRPIVSLA